jgi:hypothetical protein
MQQQIGLSEEIAGCLLGLADVAASSGEAATGSILLGASDAHRELLDQALPAIDLPAYKRTVATLEEIAGPSEFRKFSERGRTMPLNQAIEIALDFELPSPLC